MSRKISKPKRSVVDVLRMLAYLVALLCLVVLAVTGFYPVLVLGEHISGYPVMVHATFAPVFAVCVAVLAVMWARNCRFTPGDWPWFERLVRRATLAQSAGEKPRGRNSGLGQKITFWLIVFLALPLGLSIVLSMFPLFGTHGQEFLAGIRADRGGARRPAAQVRGEIILFLSVILLYNPQGRRRAG
ncbi:MAG: cytochrome b/b6 domain-containing protein [Planctomycetota bacterium]|jgi:cytochrome b subunit of formate dehydrogenase